jgi:hypothetical protein
MESPACLIIRLIDLSSSRNRRKHSPPQASQRDGVESRPSSFARIKYVLSAQDQPSYAQSFRFFLFGNWWNILLVFIPLSFLSHHLNWDAGLRFGFSFMAIMPLAQVCIWYLIAVRSAHPPFKALG